MKYAVVILALVVLFSATASAFTWGTWEVVDTVSGDLDQVAMAVRQGKVALVYQKTYVYGVACPGIVFRVCVFVEIR